MHRLYRASVTTPIGEMLALASDFALCALEFQSPARLSRLDARLRRWFPDHAVEDRESPAIATTRAWLTAYFDGAGSDPNVLTLRLDMRGGKFELAVWEALRQIPAGSTTTYGEVAKRIGSAGASRAVGLANGANPIAIIVPCHRVIGASGALIGYGGGLDRKTWLLAHERRWRESPQRTLFEHV
jgi:O-6-methylguanine DNA methyltransferase